MSYDRYSIDGHKLYWHLDRVAAWQQHRLIAPVYVEISPVSYCNHHCIFCGLDFAHTQHVSLDSEVLRSRISEMGQLGVKSIMFAGEGEPLLHPDLAELVTHTKSSGIDVSLTTNGMTGTSGLWKHVLPSLTWARFSIDAATPETYATIHGVPPASFERTLASLREAITVKQEYCLPVTIGVQFLMVKQNLCDIERALHLYSGLGVDYLSFKPYSEHPQMLQKSGYTYNFPLIDSIERTVREFTREHGHNTAIIFRKVATEVYCEGKPRFSSCCATPFWGYISSVGDFYTCSVHLDDERFKTGNMYSETMKSIFFGEKRKKSISFAEHDLKVGHECRVNCRMARINEFLAFLNCPPDHINFI